MPERNPAGRGPLPLLVGISLLASLTLLALAPACAGEDEAAPEQAESATETITEPPEPFVRHFTSGTGLECADAGLFTETGLPVHVCVTPRDFGSAVERPHANVICEGEDANGEILVSALLSNGSVAPQPPFPEACQRTLDASGLEIPEELPVIDESEIVVFCRQVTGAAKAGRLRVTADPVPSWLSLSEAQWQYQVFISALELDRPGEDFADRGLERVRLPASVRARMAAIPDPSASDSTLSHWLAPPLRALGWGCDGARELDMSEMPDLSNLTAVPPRPRPPPRPPKPPPAFVPAPRTPLPSDPTLAAAYRTVQQKLKFPYVDDTLWDKSYTLNALTGNAGASARVLAFFVDGRYVGHAGEFELEKEGRSGDLVSRSDREFVFEYDTYLDGDPSCCPSGPTGVVRYSWNGSKLSADVEFD